ncbi:hypothetical protein D9611_001607 [Ephemerocybe angulata]|uniref:Uncharacterized protein n=2 Tax=Ephemerocybe angulata TaxID=980116 RepID=A0A8H5FLZ8_9AGAR|nr:hypothetical protein D9611_001607 [Tulosesus angulatus]KAF6757207.1 NADH-ubiquinone oxidoreductase 12 kDa subunit [Tulosesus angulatus]
MSNAEKVAQVKAQLEERENILRESWVKAMEARLVQEELGKCQKGEGVNHYENCKWLADKYLGMLKENRLKGYRKIDV